MKLFGSGSKRLCNPRRTFGAIIVVLLGLAANAIAAGPQSRLDDELAFRSAHNDASSRNTRAIVMLRRGAALPAEFGAYAIRPLKIIDGYVVNVPNTVLARLAAHPSVLSVHFDRTASKFDYRTSITVGSLAVNQSAGVTGAGIGVAVIDSGITSWHDDLTSRLERAVSLRQSARCRVRRLRRRRHDTRTTTTATARTSPASSPATATTRTARRPASRPTRISFR